MSELSLDQLTDDQLEKLEVQLKAKQDAQAKQRLIDLDALDTLESDALEELFPKAKDLSSAIVNFKRDFLDKVEPLIDMKIKYGKAAKDQESYTFKTKNKKVKGVIRYNRTNRYDDGIQAAIGYAKEWLKNQVDSEKGEMLVSLIDELLSKDTKGNYSPANLLKFVKKAEEMNDPLIMQSADAIKKSIYDDMTSVSVLLFYKDDLGVERQLPLSATKA